MILCDFKSPAKRRYVQSAFGIMLSYMGLVAVSRMAVTRWHPAGWHLYLAAALPTIPMLCFAYVVGRYLREETDEYQRDMVVRGMLWGTAVALSLSVFTSFLHAYGWTGSLPEFSEFMVFWLTVAVVKAVTWVQDRMARND